MPLPVAVVGNLGVGKSALVHALLTGTCAYPAPTIAGNIRRFRDIIFYEISGAERFFHMRVAFTGKAEIIMLCVDLSSLNAFTFQLDHGEHRPVILIFTKCDLPCLYTDTDVERFIKHLGPIQVISVSVATNAFETQSTVLQTLRGYLPAHEVITPMETTQPPKKDKTTFRCCWPFRKHEVTADVYQSLHSP